MAQTALLAALAIITAVAAPVTAGPLLDDYLNYARLGEICGPGPLEVVLTKDQPIGQTVKIASGTGEVYRIGAMPNPEPDSWGEGEVVTCTLYDSPSKSKKLGSFSIDWRTNRISGTRGSEADRLLLWPLRAPVAGLQSAYMEFTVEGGDGSVRFRAVPQAGYADGQGYKGGQPQTWDLSFETHVKPVPDTKANLKKLFTETFDLSIPQLAAVKTAVEKEDYETAIAEMVKHFRNRKDLYDESVMPVKIDPKFDNTLVEHYINGRLLLQGDRKVVLPWRTESYWAPEYLGYGKKVDPWFYGWGIVRDLWYAYSVTGDEKYAKAGMERVIQWMLDNNPNPKITGIKGTHEIWNELAAAGRAPGHFAYVFSRVYNYKGFTNDQQLMYFLNWYDNANFLLDSPVGGNWLAQAASAAYGFGKNFPEFKQKTRFLSWGVAKLAEVSMETVRGDGTQHEAAIKYHGMVARRLKSLMDDHTQGLAKIDPKVVPYLERNLARMYDWMAYTLQPNSYVVMTGDSWYENYTGELAEVGKIVNRPDFVWIATQGKQGVMPKEVSKAYPEGGYYIMRSDFGGPGKEYADARQLYMHNGSWVGSHGHFDLTNINLYAYGRTLIVDPGGMWTPPAGVPPYWESRIHSMLVPDGKSCKREPGPTMWYSAQAADYLNSTHYGYSGSDITVKRQIMFVKPGYFVVNDSAENKGKERQWDQVWNMMGKNIAVDPATLIAETTFPSGANLIVAPVGANPSMQVVKNIGAVPMGEGHLVDTTLVNYRYTAQNPRYTTVLYPYKGSKPGLQVARIPADPTAKRTDKPVGVRIASGNKVDFVAWGDPEAVVSFSDGKHVLAGEAMSIQTEAGKSVKSLSAFNSRRVVFNGREYFRCDFPMAMVDIVYGQGSVNATLREAHPSLGIWVGSAASVTINGKKYNGAVPKGGILRPFASAVNPVIVDDNSPNLRKITEGNEWTLNGNPWGFDLNFTTHETDVGRKEAAAYTVDVPFNGSFKLEVFCPKSYKDKSSRMQYSVKSLGVEKGAVVGGAIKDAKAGAEGEYVVTVNQQEADGVWLNLGTFRFQAGRQELLTGTNVTEIDGQHATFDAVRLTPQTN